MSEVNPYAAPLGEPAYAGKQDHSLACWRDNKILIMPRDGRLPLICVKSNQPAERYLRRKLAWHRPAIYLLLLCNILIFALVALICQKKADIEIGLSEEWFVKRRRACWIGWSSFLLGIGLFAVFIWLLSTFTYIGDLHTALVVGTLPLSVAVAVIGGIYGLVASRMVTPQKIDENYLYLRGCHPDFLARFPDWPGAL